MTLLDAMSIELKESSSIKGDYNYVMWNTYTKLNALKIAILNDRELRTRLQNKNLKMIHTILKIVEQVSQHCQCQVFLFLVIQFIDQVNNKNIYSVNKQEK